MTSTPTPWLLRRIFPILGVVGLIAIGMAGTIWGPLYWGESAWAVPDDLWATLVASERLLHLDLAGLYTAPTNLVSFPGAALILVPVVAIMDLAGIPVQAGQQVTHCSSPRQLGLGLDVVPWRQHERSLVRARMRQGEHGIGADLAGVADDVDVEGPRAESLFPDPAEVRFDPVRRLEQVPRWQAGPQQEHRVQVVRLGRAADRDGFVDR